MVQQVEFLVLEKEKHLVEDGVVANLFLNLNLRLVEMAVLLPTMRYLDDCDARC